MTPPQMTGSTGKLGLAWCHCVPLLPGLSPSTSWPLPEPTLSKRGSGQLPRAVARVPGLLPPAPTPAPDCPSWITDRQLRGSWHLPAKRPEPCPAVRGGPRPARPALAQEGPCTSCRAGAAVPGRGRRPGARLPAAAPGGLGAAEPQPGVPHGAPTQRFPHTVGSGLLYPPCSPAVS